MAKRPPLGGSAPPAKPAVHAAPLETAPVQTVRARSRQGKVQVAGYLDQALKREIDVFAAREGRSLQSIFEEMHDLFAERHGLHRITSTR
jgi:hypothetical protein